MTDDTNPGAPPLAANAAFGTPVATDTDAAKASAMPEGKVARLTDDIVAALKTVYDQEIPADI